MKYKKIILKLSGETLSGNNAFGFNFDLIKKVAKEIKETYSLKVKIGIVTGAGNIFRARMIKNNEVSRVEADYMGIIGTVLNAVCLSNVLNSLGVKARVLSNLDVPSVAEKYFYQKAVNYWKKGEVLIFCGGIGNPYFTTDTAAILKALELDADAVLKATQVNGIYDKDPEKYKDAKMYKTISYHEALKKRLKIIDATAFALAMDNSLPIRVFKLAEGNLKKVVQGKDLGTLVN